MSPFLGHSSNAHSSQNWAKAEAKARSMELKLGLPHEQQEHNQLRHHHCSPTSTLAASQDQDPQVSIQSKYSDRRYGCHRVRLELPVPLPLRANFNPWELNLGIHGPSTQSPLQKSGTFGIWILKSFSVHFRFAKWYCNAIKAGIFIPSLSYLPKQMTA